MAHRGGICTRIGQKVQTELHSCIPLLRSLGREEGLRWLLARGQLTMKCKSQLSPDPSAACREIPHSHLPPSFQSRCLEGWARTEGSFSSQREKVHGKRRNVNRSQCQHSPGEGGGIFLPQGKDKQAKHPQKVGKPSLSIEISQQENEQLGRTNNIQDLVFACDSPCGGLRGCSKDCLCPQMSLMAGRAFSGPKWAQAQSPSSAG